MDQTLFGMANFDTYAVLGILLFFSTLEICGGLLKDSRRRPGDWWLEITSFFTLSILIKPFIVITILFAGNQLLPGYQFVLSGQSLWLMLPAYLLIDDLLQYWYHRSAHEYHWLWKLHRPHHLAEVMGLLVSYRNAALYYVLMPNIWWIGLFTFLGGAKAVALGLILKQLVIISSHSPTKWDQYLYRYKWLNPLTTLVERIIVTPAFHFAHHGKSLKDGISDPNGNYGNMFSLWDQLFGTAVFTRRYPVALGLPKDPKDPFVANYLYPLVKSSRTGSEISKGYKKEKSSRPEPSTLQLDAAKYLWCRCGFSENQPFCDGSHHGTKFKPLLFEVKRKSTFRLCNCKMTRSGPFCDDSHLESWQSAESNSG